MSESIVVGVSEPRVHTPFRNDLPSRGQELIDLANKIGEPLMPWQEIVATESMRIKPDGRYAFPQCVVLVSRQNGKSHLMRLRIIWGLLNGEKLQILAAHKLAVSLEHFNQIVDTIEANDFLLDELKSIRRTNGQEQIKFKNGATFKVVANNAAGRGYAGAETIYLDELREHKDYGAWSAISKTQLAAKNPMLYGFSNAGDATSIVLNELRDRGRATVMGKKDSLLWIEFSAPANSPIDIEALKIANPALGRTIHIDNLLATLNEPEAVIRCECLCQWVDTLESPWSINAWSNCIDKDIKVDPAKQAFLAFDITPRRTHCSLVGGQVIDGKIVLGLLAEFDSDTAIDDLTIANGVAEFARQYDVTEIYFSKNTGAAIAQRLQAAGISTKAVDGRMFAQACDQMLSAMEHGRLVHADQENFNKQISACVRVNFSDGGWIIGRRASSENVSAAVAAAMVISAASVASAEVDIYAV